ncbi:M48 family metallopeptidase [Tissierella sp. Yu-01]|uniref:M48 family metallopeptidase n=1 Tax=Tissierella sp. Yu-01 TaxID=3035694 RepID=UPI00240E8363|nr:M48 family metallopeptidase [Tissierella sp. Yu-01]WFA08950.1 M48 family metallopeptidase [Tissierella sp. Yu-01]
MDKRLLLIILLFFILLIIFITFVYISEVENMTQLKVEYPELKEEVYSFRVDSLKVWGLRLLLSFVIPMFFLFTKLSQRISHSVGDGRSWFLSGLLYGIIFFGLVFIINLPLEFYSSFVLRHRYGLTDQSILRWLELNIKGFLVNDLITSLFIWVPYYIIYTSPKSWWFKIGLLAIPVIVFMVFISPFVIDPIFNDYTSIEDERLGKNIEVLLEKAGIEDAQIYKVDKSKDTKTMNAYMTGIFKSKRIVLWDTTINNLTEDEVLSITAHEIGHYVKGHIWENIIFSSIGSIVMLYLVYISSNWVLKLSNGTFGFRNLYNFASIPLLIIMLNLYSFLGNPITSYISRRMEMQADRYEVSLVQNRESAITAMEKLYDTSLGVPRPSNIYKIWYHTHPPLEERVEFYKTVEFEEIK